MEFRYEKDPMSLFPQMMKMLEDHREESSLFGDFKVDPDWERYQAIQDSGFHAVITAWDNGLLVGYSINFVLRHMHYDFTIGYNDLIYMEPKYRFNAMKLLKVTERILKDKGVYYFTLSVKPHVDYRPLLERMGYDLLEYQYFRRL